LGKYTITELNEQGVEMVFEPNFTKVVSSVRKNVGMTQSVVELKLPTNENDISKLYSVGAKSTITSSEINGKDVVFTGLVDFQAVYESDGISAIDYTAEFKDRLVSSENLSGELIVSSSVMDVNSTIVSGGVRVVAVVEVSVDIIESKELNILTSVGGDDTHVSTGEIEYSSFVGRAYEKFDVSEEISLSGVTNVLMVTPCVSLQNIEPRENYIVVTGRLYLDMCCQEGEGPQDISTRNHSVDFTWEVALSGVEDDSIVQSVVNIISNEIKISTMIEDGVAKMNLYIPMTYSGYVFNENKLQVVEDLYLERNYLSVTCENYYTIDCGKSISFRDNISGTASISETAPFIDEVLSVSTNNLVLANSRIEDGRLSIEGIANATVVYYTKETNEKTSVQVEMPFAVEQRVESQEGSVVTMCISEISARSKRGKEIEVSAELNVYVDLYGHNNGCVISEVSLGESKPKDDCPLYIYIVKDGQTLWDVAKDTNSSQEQILEQNPNLELPISAGNRLVVYKSNYAKF
jgi:hypothetical protein